MKKSVLKFATAIATIAMISTLLFSCQKQDTRFSATQNNRAPKQISETKELKGISILINTPGFDKRLIADILPNGYHYFSNGPSNHLWIISLPTGTYGFALFLLKKIELGV